MLRFHSQTAGSTLTAQQPQNNVIRVTLQALAAVLGGTQSLHTNSLDEALALPTEKSAQIALRTQQIIAHESNVIQTVDPLGGSWYVEKLTDEIEKRALKYLDEIDRRGGMVTCIESGYIQNEILNSAYSDQRKIDQNDISVVGVNCFTEDVTDENGRDSGLETLKISHETEKNAIERVKAYRKKRSQGATKDAIRALEEGAKEADVNLQARILTAVKAGATLGEISEVIRRVFGEYMENKAFL